MNKLLFIILFVMCVFSSFAMRCGNGLIDEGDHINKVVQYCGNSSSYSNSYLYYRNLNGWNVLMHINNKGYVDRIEQNKV